MEYRSTRRWISSALVILLLVVFSTSPLIESLFAQTVLDIDVALESTTVNRRTGEVTITGTVACSEAVSTFVFVQLTQPVGRTNAVNGFTSIPVACAGPDVRQFSVRVLGVDGRFAPGIAYLSLGAQGCTVPGPAPYPAPPPIPQCDSDQLTTVVSLNRAR